jgi:hypothetical protein
MALAEAMEGLTMVEQCWLTCPECGAPGSLLCAIDGPHPTDLTLLDQACTCDPSAERWPDVWRDAQVWLQERACAYPDDAWPDAREEAE